MYVDISESDYIAAKEIIESFDYVDYDKNSIVITDTIGYHTYVNVFDDICATGIECSTANNQLIDKFKELYTLYVNFVMLWIIPNSNKTGKDYFLQKVDVLDYVLYRMGITDINTLFINMYGIRKLELYEY